MYICANYHCRAFLGGGSLRRSFLAAEYITIFISGAFAYGLIELAVRGRTHITMGLLGGAAMCLIHRLNDGDNGALSWFVRMIFSALCITAAELFAGLILNVRMGLGIWNYSRMPYNLFGQICPAFSLIWFSLSGLGMLYDTAVCRFILHRGANLTQATTSANCTM